ncbi:MAG: hypothetical protein IJJ26_13370 [Victivallales bacterium]|nr:hypothetical protein [Victivallales bacterium]
MRKALIHKLHYTLVEVMVAMAVLVMMMGFLFQFTIGAQRIWSASSRSTAIFDTAQIIFQTFEQDLRNAVVSDEPQRAIPFYMHYPAGGKGDFTCGMFSNFTSGDANAAAPVTTVGTYPVLYAYKYWDGTDANKTKTSNKLYRIPIDNTTLRKRDGSTFNISYPWYLVGADYTSVSSSNDFFGAFLNTVTTACDMSDFELIGSGIEYITCGVNTTTGLHPTSANVANHYTTKMSNFYYLKFSLYDPAADDLEGSIDDENTPRGKRVAETRHTFSKVIFLD